MSFEDLPPLPALQMPGAQDYADRIVLGTRRAMETLRYTGDIKYSQSDYWQKLDIYQPKESTAVPRPVFCFLHGGAWRNGCKEWMGFMAPPIVDAGAIFVSASYRRVPHAKLSATLDDVQSMFAWVFRNIGHFGGDVRRVHIGGHSAGAHLAALAALDTEGLIAHGISLDGIRGCHLISGVYDLTDGHPHSIPSRALFAGLLERDSDAYLASPIRHIEKRFTGMKLVSTRDARPSFHVSWGTRDLPRFDHQAEVFVEALQSAGATVVAQQFDDYDHWQTSECAADPNHPWTEVLLRQLCVPAP